MQIQVEQLTPNTSRITLLPETDAEIAQVQPYAGHQGTISVVTDIDRDDFDDLEDRVSALE